MTIRRRARHAVMAERLGCGWIPTPTTGHLSARDMGLLSWHWLVPTVMFLSKERGTVSSSMSRDRKYRF